MKRVVLVFFYLVSSEYVIAQNLLVDSLKERIGSHKKEDTLRVSLLLSLATEEIYNHPSEAGKYAFEAKSIAEAIRYPSGVAMAYRLIGNAFWSQANQTAALDNFLKGLRIADSIKSPQVQADLLGNLGMVYSDINDFATALKYYKSSLKKQIELKNKLREAVLRVNVGNGFYRLHQYDSSLLYYNQALTKLGGLKNTRSYLDLVTIGIGEVYADLGKYDVALDYYYRAKKSIDTTNHSRGMVHSRMAIAKVFMKKEQYAAAEKELLEAIDFAKQVNLKTYVRDCYELLSQIAQKQNRLPQFISYYKSFISYKDSIQNSAQASKITSLQLEYQMQNKELEIGNLKKDALLKNQELKFKNTLLISSLVGIFLVILFSVSVFRNYRNQKTLNKELAARNEENNKQRIELSRQHNELLALNEEIRAQQDEVVSQRDRLSDKNEKIESLSKRLLELNQSLEQIVEQRTIALQEQNKKLEEYAFLNAHKLRAPVASIIGLIDLLQLKDLMDDRSVILSHLRKSSLDLDQVIRNISNTLQQGISAYPSKEDDKS